MKCPTTGSIFAGLFARPMTLMMVDLAKRLAAPVRPHLRPSLIIIGAQKAGTSAVFDIVARHPAFLAPTVKELMFFNREEEYTKGSRHYFRQFPLRPLRGAKLTLEASVGYLDHPEAPARIRALLPEVRLAVILRDPVSRAFSAWNMFRQFAGHPEWSGLYDPRPFEQAVADEISGKPIHKAHRYLERGRYAPGIQRYQALFAPDRLLVLSYGQLKRDPAGTLDAILGLVGERAEHLDPSVFAIRSNRREYDSVMSPELRERIAAHCAPWQSELEAALGRPFPLS